jgi:hypothetical protein
VNRYRVLFSDGSERIVEARAIDDAVAQAKADVARQGQKIRFRRVDCLSLDRTFDAGPDAACAVPYRRPNIEYRRERKSA